MRRFIGVLHPAPVPAAARKADHLPLEAFTPRFMKSLIGLPLTTEHCNTRTAVNQITDQGQPITAATVGHQLTVLAKQPTLSHRLQETLRQKGLAPTPAAIHAAWQEAATPNDGYGVIGAIERVFQDPHTQEIKAVCQLRTGHLDAQSQALLDTMISPGGNWGSLSLTTYQEDGDHVYTPLELSPTGIPLRSGCRICPASELHTYDRYVKMTEEAVAVAPVEAPPSVTRDVNGRFASGAKPEPDGFMEKEEFRTFLGTLNPDQRTRLLAHEQAMHALVAEEPAVQLSPELEQKLAQYEKSHTDFMSYQNGINSVLLGTVKNHGNLIGIQKGQEEDLFKTPEASLASCRLITAALGARLQEYQLKEQTSTDNLDAWYKLGPSRHQSAKRQAETLDEPVAKRYIPENLVTAGRTANPLPADFCQGMDRINAQLRMHRETRAGQRFGESS